MTKFKVGFSGLTMYNNIKDVLPEKLKGFPHPSMIAIKPAPSSPKEK